MNFDKLYASVNASSNYLDELALVKKTYVRKVKRPQPKKQGETK